MNLKKRKSNLTVSLDCMGGDKAPQIVVEGAEIVAFSNPSVHFLLFGDSKRITPILNNCPSLKLSSTVLHTEDYISGDEKPSVALRRGTKSSMRLAIDAVKEGDADVVVSAGNTGALMAMSKVVLRALPAIDRPAIVTSIPNQKGSATILLDMGANVECDSEVLFQFAVMGYAFARAVLKIPNPSIGILNIGSEDLKGNDAVRSAASLLKESDLKDSFYGYVEGDDILKGTTNIVVTDGFTGNIALKAIEGTVKLMSTILKQGFSSSILSKIGYLLASGSIDKATSKIDPRRHNGAMLVGLNGLVVKSHGSTDKTGFANAIEVAISLVKNEINDQITRELKSSVSVSNGESSDELDE